MKGLSTKVIAFAFVFIVFLIALAFGIAYVYGTTDIDFRELFGLGSVEEEWKSYEPVETTTETTTTIPPSGKCDIECKKLYFASGTCKDSCELGETRLDKSNGYDFQIRAADAHITAFLPDSKNYQPNAWGFVEDLGINALRLFTGGEGDIAHLNMKRYPNEWAENLNNFLSEADAHGVKVYFYELGTEWNTLLGIRPEDTTIEEAKSMIDKLAGYNNLGHDFINDDRILVWSVDNEPSISKNPIREEDYKRLEWILEISDYIRSKGKNNGGKTVVASPRLDDNWGKGQDFYVTEPIFRDHVDYLERHSYKSVEFYQTCVDTGNPFSFEDCYNKMYASYKKQLQEEMIDGKGSFSVDQLIFGEFGVWIGESGTKSNQGCINCFFEDEHRRAYYKAVLDAARDVGIKNICFHNLFSRTEGPSWTENLIPDYGVVDVDGSYHDEELASIIKDAYKTGESYCDAGYTCCCSPVSTTSVLILHKTKQDSLRNWAESDRAWYAENFDMLTTSHWSIKNTETGEWLNYLPEMHAVNPDLKVLLYWNVPNIDENSKDYDMLLANEWVLKGKNGDVVTRKGDWPSLKGTDIGNEEYRKWLANKIAGYTSSKHIYGIMADNTATSARARYDPIPINPRTGREYTDEDYTNDMVELIKEVKRVTGKVYVGNGYGTVCGGCPWSGYQKHKDNAEKIINAVDGVLLEGFIRWSGDSEWKRSVEEWIQDIDYVDYLMDRSKIVGVWTLTSGERPPTHSQYDIAMYGFTSYLLVAEGGNKKTYFTARGYDKTFRSLIGDLEVGQPLESYHIRSDVPIYEREFSKVLVLVNPNDKFYTVSLGKKYVTLDGKEVSSITLNDHSGAILKVIPESFASTSFKKYIIIYGGYHSWDDDIDYFASNFDLVDTGENQAEDVANLKEMNPDIVAVFYKDIIAIHEDYPDWDEIDKYHEDWFLHDTDNNRIRSTQWNHWYLMNPESNGWRNHYADKVKDVLDQYPQFDGVYADDCWGSFPPASWDYFVNDDYKIPDYIRDNWIDWIKGMLQVVKNKIGDKLLIINCNRNPLVYIDYVDGRMDEGFAHAPWQSSDEFHSVKDWEDDVDALYQWSGKNKHIMTQGGVEPGATDAQKKSLMTFCLSSYLLGVNGPKATFGFKPDAYQWGYRYDWIHPEYDSVEELGSPTNDYYQTGSVYARDFENGKVLVNPTTSSYTVALDKEYMTLDGKKVSSITLNPHTGAILKAISEPPASLSQNLLKNPDFTNGMNNWGAYPEEESWWSIDTGTYYSTPASLKCVLPERQYDGIYDPPNSGGWSHTWNFRVPVQAGQRVKAYGVVKTEGGYGYVGFDFRDANGKITRGFADKGSPYYSDWVKLKLESDDDIGRVDWRTPDDKHTLVAQEGEVSVTFHFSLVKKYGDKTSGRGWLDNAELYVIPA